MIFTPSYQIIVRKSIREYVCPFCIDKFSKGTYYFLIRVNHNIPDLNREIKICPNHTLEQIVNLIDGGNVLQMLREMKIKKEEEIRQLKEKQRKEEEFRKNDIVKYRAEIIDL